MFTIAVCDDFPEELNIIKALLNMYRNERPGMDIHYGVFDSSEQLADALGAGQRFNLYLLDVLMPKIDGIALAQQIRAVDMDATVVFLTQSEDYALDAYRVSAMQYIVKPINKGILFTILDKIIAGQKQEEELFYVLSAPGRTVNILYSSIVAIEYIGRALRFHLTNGQYIESKTIRSAFSQAVAEIVKDKRFLSVHQSFVINMTHVRELHNRFIYMNNNLEVPIPRPKFVTVKNAYLRYLAEISAKLCEGA
ncbi:MAG: LytTR family DNA-binding domain-containing protein [Defluviitaleaceae bacterium]|nr:LytTR family DNA-binding domain-containing protein [Defluviitaleaceae bacterium]